MAQKKIVVRVEVPVDSSPAPVVEVTPDPDVEVTPGPDVEVTTSDSNMDVDGLESTLVNDRSESTLIDDGYDPSDGYEPSGSGVDHGVSLPSYEPSSVTDKRGRASSSSSASSTKQSDKKISAIAH